MIVCSHKGLKISVYTFIAVSHLFSALLVIYIGETSLAYDTEGICERGGGGSDVFFWIFLMSHAATSDFAPILVSCDTAKE